MKGKTSQIKTPPPDPTIDDLDPLKAAEKEDKAQGKEEKKEPPPKQKVKIKAKIDGIEEDVELDEDQVKRLYQIEKASNKRFQEAAAKEKRAEEALSKLSSKEQLGQLLQERGWNIYDLAEEVLAEKLKYQLMTPEQRQIMELQHEKAQLMSAQQKREQDEKTKVDGAERQRLAGEYQTQIIEALKTTNIPKTARSVAQIASLIKDYWQRGVEITFKEAAEMVAADRKAYYAELAKGEDIGSIKELIGKDKISALLKDSLSQVSNPTPRADRQREEAPLKSKGRSYLTEDDFEKHLSRFKQAR